MSRSSRDALKGLAKCQDVLEALALCAGFHQGLPPDRRGEIRTYHLRLDNIDFPAPVDVPMLMGVLIERISQLWNDCTCAGDDFHVAALGAYGLLAIHPFKNGNGRTSMDFVQLLLMWRWDWQEPPLLDPPKRYRHLPVSVATKALNPIVEPGPDESQRLATELARQLEGATLEGLYRSPFHDVARYYWSQSLGPAYEAAKGSFVSEQTSSVQQLPGGELVNGDFQEIMHRVRESGRVFVLTDPPYNIGFKYNSYADRLSSSEYIDLLARLRDLPAAVIHYPEESSTYLSPALGPVAKVVVWCYLTGSNRVCRNINFFRVLPGAGAPARNDWWDDIPAEPVNSPDRDHPCPLPVRLAERIIELCTEPGDLIFDPFAGSGSVLVAAQRLNRRFLGCEIDPLYCQAAVRRLTVRS